MYAIRDHVQFNATGSVHFARRTLQRKMLKQNWKQIFRDGTRFYLCQCWLLVALFLSVSLSFAPARALAKSRSKRSPSSCRSTCSVPLCTVRQNQPAVAATDDDEHACSSVSLLTTAACTRCIYCVLAGLHFILPCIFHCVEPKTTTTAKKKNKIYIRILCIPFIRAVCARSKYNLYILLLSILHGCCFYLLLHNKQFRAPVATVSNLYLCIFIRWMCGRYECWAHVKRENRRNRFCCCCSASSCRFICCFCCYCCCCYHSGFSMHLVCSYYMHYERRRRRRKQ